MDLTAKDEMWNVIVGQFINIQEKRLEMTKHLTESCEYQLDYLQAVFVELCERKSGPPVAKTPKIPRKKGFTRIETIPENDVFRIKDTSTSPVQFAKKKEEEEDELTDQKLKRKASLKAVNDTKKQHLFVNATKVQRSSEDEDDKVFTKKQKRGSRLKRKKSTMNNSSEDENDKNSKHSKLTEKNAIKNTESPKETRKKSKLDQLNMKVADKTKEFSTSQKLQSSINSTSEKSKSKEEGKTVNTKNSLVTSETEEPSMYEDAIGKPTPIMNSTMKYSPVISEKIFNATVVIEPLVLKQRNLNETVVIKKNSTETTSLKRIWQDSMQENKKTTQTNVTYTCNDLITDDESSPELKKNSGVKKQKKAISSSSEDEVPNTPVETRFKEPIMSTVKPEIKSTHKSNALFSPYAKESVRKRVEAFEQAVMNTGSNQTDVTAGARITRTKTRAMTKEAETKTNVNKSLTQMCARKSLAKAKKIANLVEKQKKDNEEESKENKEQLPERINKLLTNDESNVKQMPQQLKTTPLNKIKIPPISANRFHTPSNTPSVLNYSKPSTATRPNIVTGVSSFIQAPKTASKNISADKVEDKKRYEEDAIKKRNEALRLQTEEKRRKRKEKELKNKLARKAQEKLELEKRQKAEKEREEKARIAQLLQEKQREEMEKKRLAQLQRAQEKEERRKLEEQQRLQRLQEQEEAERLLAEQRRREQEAEKRREAEARAQQQAAAESLKQKKNQMLLAAHAKYKHINNKQNTSCYKLESEPDDDESDEETRPKYEIPHWAQSHVRKAQLEMQQYIPEEIVYKFFDTRKCTPDLTELFHGIDQRRLQRTSSAIWKTPPRFSMMEID